MTIQTTTLRPGLLVSVKTMLKGNVSYIKTDLECGTAEETVDVAKWETERKIADRKEYDAARKARGLAATAVRRLCAHSAFGMLCPEDRAADLEAAVIEARRITDEFNATAKMTRISVYVMTGRIAPDDVEAVKAINSEVRDLLDDMKTGVENLDAKVIREAAAKARNLGSMLTPDAQARIQIAIDAARSAAKDIVKQGEQAAMEIDRRAIRTLTEQRTAFLDMDDVAAVAAPKAQGRAVDLTPAADMPAKLRSNLRASIEMKD